MLRALDDQSESISQNLATRPDGKSERFASNVTAREWFIRRQAKWRKPEQNVSSFWHSLVSHNLTLSDRVWKIIWPVVVPNTLSPVCEQMLGSVSDSDSTSSILYKNMRLHNVLLSQRRRWFQIQKFQFTTSTHTLLITSEKWSIVVAYHDMLHDPVTIPLSIDIERIPTPLLGYTFWS